MKREKTIEVISLTDAHVPFENKTAVDLAIRYCGAIQPAIIVMHEWHDFYAISRFDKNPLRKHTLQDELDQVGVYFWALRKVCPKSRIILLNSNHLDRLRKYLWSRAPELASLRSLELGSLLELDKYNIEFMEVFEFKGVLFKHGEVIRKDSGATAKAEFQKEKMSGVSGHSHRIEYFFTTLRGGKYVWVCSGCLSMLQPEYMSGIPDWQNAITKTTFYDKNKDSFHTQVLPIIDNKLLLDRIIFK